jgi:hypothetical protein
MAVIIGGAGLALGERGPRRAERFTWQRAANETLSVYRRVASDHKPAPNAGEL